MMGMIISALHVHQGNNKLVQQKKFLENVKSINTARQIAQVAYLAGKMVISLIA